MDDWFERSPFIGFAPWIIYWVVADGPSTWMFGALCAVISALILGVSVGRGGPRLLRASAERSNQDRREQKRAEATATLECVHGSNRY